MSCARPITPRMSQRRSRALLLEVASGMRLTTSFLCSCWRSGLRRGSRRSGDYCSFDRRSVTTISAIAAACGRAQSRRSSPASETQLIG